MAEKDLADSIVVAPINGYISEKNIEIGEMGQPGQSAFKIENTEKLKISAYIAAEHSNHIRPNQTEVELSVNGMPVPGRFKINYVSPVIDPKMHIFEIRCLIEENNMNLKPGQSVALKIFLEEYTALCVAKDSLLESMNECAIFVCENNRVRKLSVIKGYEYEGWTEIKEPRLTVGSKIVSEGQFLISDNSRVTVIE